MLSVRLGPELEARLNELAEATGRSKSHYVRQVNRPGFFGGWIA